jgi:carbon monoxide dehydrogenase subunit G
MELQNEFTVPAPVSEVWKTLLDVERIAPCLPGATVDRHEGDEVAGRVNVKVGPITASYAERPGSSPKTNPSTALSWGRTAGRPGAAAAPRRPSRRGCPNGNPART